MASQPVHNADTLDLAVAVCSMYAISFSELLLRADCECCGKSAVGNFSQRGRSSPIISLASVTPL